MGYAEIRIQREVQQLRRELKEAKARDEQTRAGCLDLVQALRAIVASRGGSEAAEFAQVTELVEQAGRLFDPPPAEA